MFPSDIEGYPESTNASTADCCHARVVHVDSSHSEHCMTIFTFVLVIYMFYID